MVYLLENSGYYKVGSTQNLQTRLQSYKTNNPTNTVVLDIIELAGEIEENQLHQLLEKYKHRNEWYIKDKNVIKIWNEFKSKNKPLLNSKQIQNLLEENKRLKKENNQLKNKIQEMESDYKKIEELNESYNYIKGQYNELKQHFIKYK